MITLAEPIPAIMSVPTAVALGRKLGVFSKNTLERAIGCGAVPVYRPGGCRHRLVKREDLVNWLLPPTPPARPAAAAPTQEKRGRGQRGPDKGPRKLVGSTQ
jgi:hypothetical protein